MKRKHFEYYKTHENRTFSDQQYLITYSFNSIEQNIVGLVEEKKNLIYLYEYRGKYIGTEFLISFSNDSTSYKLLKISEIIK
jgi:hypothetical protein